MTDAFVTAAGPLVTDFKRNLRGQPLITPPDGGKPIAYNRPSSWGRKLEDLYGLEQWSARCIVTGMSRTPSLIARAAAITADPKAWTKADKDALNLIADEAKTAARSNEAADIGTALHRMTERVDLGEDLSDLPEPFKSDIAAYTAGMQAHGLVTRPEWVECRMVCDELQLAGTVDRIVTSSLRQELCHRIYDLKTGQSIELSALGYAVQLAIYGHSVLYDVNTGERTQVALDTDFAYIGHMPAAQATFTLHEVDIKAGWEAALLAADVDRWRKRKGLLVAVPDVPAAASAPVTNNAARVQHLRERCRTVAELGAGDRMAACWPDGLPHLTGNVTDDDLTNIEAYIATFETQVSAPFPEPLTNPQPVVETRYEDGQLIPLPDIQPDEGATVELDDPAFVAMTQRYLAVTDTTAASWMAETVGESIRAGRSIHLATRKSLRRIRIVDGLATLAAAGLSATCRGFAAVALDLPQVQDERHPLGACVSLLDAVQAAAFAGLCQAATQDLAATTAA